MVLWWAIVGCVEKERPPADLVLRHGVVRTMDADDPVQEAVAVRDGAIVFVGSDGDARAWIGPDTEVVDLDGRALLPGFVDAHTHPIWSGTELLDLSLWSATTVPDLTAAVSAHAAANPDAPWLRGGGWDVATFAGQLDRTLLDAAAPGRAVYLASSDGHSAWVSSRALDLAGIDATTADPPGGHIARDDSGAATGILLESATALVADILPEYAAAQVDAGLDAALARTSKFGITTVVDANTEAWMLAGYQRRADAGTLTVRVRGAVSVDPVTGDLGPALALQAAYDDGLVRVNAVKLYLDGVLETQTALLLAPYVDGSNAAPAFTDETLRAVVAAADDAGLQVHAHTIGDGAVRQMLDALQWLEDERGAADRRPLLAHLELIDPADIGRFAALGAVADFQPLWAYPDAYITDLTWPVIGPARSEWLYPIGAVHDAGGALAAGSDWSVSSMNPFAAMEVAVGRRDPQDARGEVLTPQHRVPIEVILAAYTTGGALAAFVEDEVGRIAVGLRADLVAVDQDPVTVDVAALSDVAVWGTWLDGRRVYTAEP